MKLTESIRSVLDVVTSACNYTEDLIGTFNSTLANSSDRMTKKMISLAELVSDDQQGGGIRFTFEVESMDLKEIVVYVMALELFMVLTFLTMMRSAKLRDRVIIPKKRQRRK
jgi:hypothetical protein